MCFKRKEKIRVWVAVCDDFPDPDGSHPENARLANDFCPNTHLGQYLSNAIPKNICTKHIAPPPIPVCKHPYHDTGKIIAFSGASLCFLTTRDNAYWKMSSIPKYLDTLVLHGINAIRSLSGFTDESLDWASYLPYRDEEYYPHIHEILGWMQERDLTMILSLMPYKGWYDDYVLRKLIQETKIYLPHIIYETANEEGNLDKQIHIVEMLLEEGVPEKYIQLSFVDSGDFARYIQAHRDISCCHCCGSEETMYVWWIGSPGCQGLLDLDMYPSDDGKDAEGKSVGYTFWDNPDARKPSPAQLYGMCKYFLKRGVGFDHLTAAGFQGYNTPNIEVEMTLGIPEMDAMYEAYKELFGE